MLRSFVQEGYSTQSGDNLLVTYDTGRQKHIYLPTFTGYTELYVASDGSTYFDRWLCQTAQEALPPTPTPTLTPAGYHTSPTPTSTLTPVGFRTPSPTPICYCSTWLEGPWTFTLAEQAPSQTVTYIVCMGCCSSVPCSAEELCDWGTISSEWLVVQPSRGFGPCYGGHYDVTISLGDVSSLSPGWHQGTVTFDIVPDYDWIRIYANYFKAAPTPVSSILRAGTMTVTADRRLPYFVLLRPLGGPGFGAGLFGREGDIPVSGDYDSDGITDLAYSARYGLWAIKGITRAYFGTASGCPVPGDYSLTT